MRRPPSTPPELPGYRYISQLGSGGFSDVFLYEQQLPRRKVAVKVLLTEQLNQSTRAQFVAEANLMAQLSTHPFIVTIYHADIAGDLRPYFVMEYCSGPSLSERYKRAPFSIEDALRTGVRLAGAVATAHAAGILHRDVKPANVLTNDFGWPALTDFGISSTVDDDLPVHTITGASLRQAGPGETGTGAEKSIGMSVPWSPPEMFEDDPQPDVRSDLFSLAATVYTLLAGQTPFEIRGRSNGTLDLIGRIERGAVTPIVRADMPRSLTSVLGKGMANRRSDRYASALDFARALQRVELELGYAPTGIEVPGQYVEAAPAGLPGEDETRARSVVTIAAQSPSAPVADPARPPAGADDTRIRPVTVVESQPAAGTVPGAADLREETLLRTRPGSAPDAGPEAAGPATPGARPGRGYLGRGIIIAAAAVLVGAIVAAVVVLGSPHADIVPTKAPAVADDATATGGVPAPSIDGLATSVDGTVVTFTLGNAHPEDGDAYRWARAETPAQPQLSKSADIAVAGIVPGSTVCIDVYLQRRDGKISEPSRACNR